MATMQVLKFAWIRDANAPAGQPALGRIDCPCGHAPASRFSEQQPNITCECGAVYRWDGWVIQQGVLQCQD